MYGFAAKSVVSFDRKWDTKPKIPLLKRSVQKQARKAFGRDQQYINVSLVKYTLG